MSQLSAADVVPAFADAIDQRDWDGLAALLAPDFRARLVHSGRTFDRDGFVAFNRDYPGAWRFTWEEVVVGGDRAVGRAQVTDGHETYYVASFLTVTAGAISDLVEVWTDVVVQVTGASWEVELPGDVDVVVLDRAPLHPAGRIALRGRLLFGDDPPARGRGKPTPARCTSTSCPTPSR